MFLNAAHRLLLFFFSLKAAFSVNSIQFLIPSLAIESVMLNFQFKGVLPCLSEDLHLYFYINWWQCFQVLVVWNQAWNTGTSEFHHSKIPEFSILGKCWYNIKCPSHTPASAFQNTICLTSWISVFKPNQSQTTHEDMAYILVHVSLDLKVILNKFLFLNKADTAVFILKDRCERLCEKKQDCEMWDFIGHVTWYLLLNRLRTRGVSASWGGTAYIFKETAQTNQQGAGCLPQC